MSAERGRPDQCGVQVCGRGRYDGRERVNMLLLLLVLLVLLLLLLVVLLTTTTKCKLHARLSVSEVSGHTHV